jgi:hypothetical protein
MISLVVSRRPATVWTPWSFSHCLVHDRVEHDLHNMKDGQLTSFSWHNDANGVPHATTAPMQPPSLACSTFACLPDVAVHLIKALPVLRHEHTHQRRPVLPGLQYEYPLEAHATNFTLQFAFMLATSQLKAVPITEPVGGGVVQRHLR